MAANAHCIMGNSTPVGEECCLRAVYADRGVAAQPVDEMRDRAQASSRMPHRNNPSQETCSRKLAMNPWHLAGILLAVVTGVLLPLQALINARLGQQTSGALFASFASFLIGTVAIGIALLVTRTPLPAWQQASGLPPWVWFGGVIGAVFVVSATVLVPRLGAAALICLAVFGQLVGSLLLDHYGVLHAPKPADAMRIAGAALVAIGALMVVRPWESA
jgi:transporter family-2 protein